MQRELTLSSYKVKNQGNNKPENFLIQFNNPIMLDNNYEYAIGLKRILNMSFTWFNVTPDYNNQLVKYSSDGGKKFEDIMFPAGVKVIKMIIKEGRKPEYLWTDKGKEYYNKHFKDLLEKNKITLYSTENEEKSSVCERWNKTIKTKMWKQFTVQGNTQYLDMLPKLVK